MESKKPKIASPPGFEVNDDAANAPVHGTNNDLTKKRTTTTSAAVAEAATRNARHTEPLATRKGNPDNINWRSTEPPIQMREVDHELQQEAKEEVIRTAPLSLTTFSLAHQGRFSASSGIPFWTRELNHNAALAAITAEQDGVFICRIHVQIAFTTDSCTGTCRMPITNLNSGLAEYYRTHSNHVEAFELEEICVPGSLSGLVRLGRVMSEDESPGTYTCEAEFGSFEADSPWAAKVYVPKKHVPDYKLVDWESEQNAVTSIESPKREPRLRQVVEFSRHIQYHREQMSATIWSNDGDDYALRTVAQILAYEFDGPQIYLEFRARQHEATWWHFHGRMNREVKHGQFTLSSLPVPNALSDEKFGVNWTDRSLESDLLQRLRELMERTISLERQVGHLRAVLRLFGAEMS